MDSQKESDMAEVTFTSLRFISGSIPQADRSQKQNLVEIKDLHMRLFDTRMMVKLVKIKYLLKR